MRFRDDSGKVQGETLPDLRLAYHPLGRHLIRKVSHVFENYRSAHLRVISETNWVIEEAVEERSAMPWKKDVQQRHGDSGYRTEI